MKRGIHVVPSGDGWAVKKEGNKKATSKTETQKKAIEVAKEIAKMEETELIIHGKNGKIREKNSYGTDNYPPKG